MAGEVGVPGVGVHQVAALEGGGHLQVDGEGAQRVVGAVEGGGRAVADHSGGASLAPAVHFEVEQGAQFAGQELDVDARAAVDVRGILPGQQCDLHGDLRPLATVLLAFPGNGRSYPGGRVGFRGRPRSSAKDRGSART